MNITLDVGLILIIKYLTTNMSIVVSMYISANARMTSSLNMKFQFNLNRKIIVSMNMDTSTIISASASKKVLLICILAHICIPEHKHANI